MWWQVGTTGAAVTAMAVALFALPSASTRTQPAGENGLVHNPDGIITVEPWGAELTFRPGGGPAWLTPDRGAEPVAEYDLGGRHAEVGQLAVETRARSTPARRGAAV